MDSESKRMAIPEFSKSHQKEQGKEMKLELLLEQDRVHENQVKRQVDEWKSSLY